ncbi:MAG: Gldg family protein [Deltaproteobacteria bacterium]|nr:Gldg family protein [Deltaproteobacteria bacterium]
MSQPKKLSKRTLIYGVSSGTAVILVAGILVFIGLLANRYFFRWDLTPDQSQSLTAISKALLQEVDKPLTMTAFFPEGLGDRQKAKEVLQTYTYHNPNISFTFLDPDRHPLKAKEAGYRFPGNILIEYNGRRQMADSADESAISDTIRKLLKTERKKIYFLTGHGERSLEDGQRDGLLTARRALDNEGYQLVTLNLISQAEVPKDAALLVIAAPQQPLFSQEIKALKDYLDRGGRVLVMLEPFKDAGLRELLARYGVELNDGIILDQNQVSAALGASAVMPIAIKYGSHRITRDFTNVVTIFPSARPLSLKTDIAGVHPLELAATTPTSWEKTGKGFDKSSKLDYDPNQDRQGPFTLAALSDISLKPDNSPEKKKQPAAKENQPEAEKRAYLAVFGDVDFASNGYFNLSMNGDLFLNTVNFLAAEEQQIVIRRGDQKAQPLMLAGWQYWVMFLVAMVLVPLVMVGAGVGAYLKRRARRGIPAR